MAGFHAHKTIKLQVERTGRRRPFLFEHRAGPPHTATLGGSMSDVRRPLAALACAVIFASGMLVSASSQAIEEVVFINPDMKGRIEGRAYQSRDSSYRLRVPDLGKKVFVKDQDISPGITVLVQFLSDELGALYVVSTKIRDDLPKDDSILPRVASRYQRLASTAPSDFTQRYFDGKHGKSYEFTLVNARGIGSYPLEVGYAPASSVQTFASHRFIVAGGYLYEFALLMHTRDAAQGLSLDQLNDKASLILNEALETFSFAVAQEPHK